MKMIKRIAATFLLFLFVFQLLPANIFSFQLVARAEADTQAPAKPENLEIIHSDVTSISIEWDAATDNIGVANYNIYKVSKRTKGTVLLVDTTPPVMLQ